MIKEITATGKDYTIAKENALAALGASAEDDVKFELIDLGTKGIFGIGARPAKVRAYIELPDAPERRSRGGEEKPTEEKREGRESRDGGRRGNRNRGRRSASGNRARSDEAASRRRAEIEEAVRDAKTKSTAMRSVVIPESDLTFEKLDVAEGENRTLDFIRTLLANMGIDAEATLYSSSDGTLRISITGEAASVLIGHHGDTLDALQYLANLAAAQKNINGEKNKLRVTVDIEGYRAKREETLRALARRKAAQALKNNRSVMLEPMSAYERRIIHSEVQGIEGVSTNSVGSDSNRKIVIYLTDKKAAESAAEAEVTEIEETEAVDVEIDNEIEIEVTETPDASDDE